MSRGSVGLLVVAAVWFVAGLSAGFVLGRNTASPEAQMPGVDSLYASTAALNDRAARVLEATEVSLRASQQCFGVMPHLRDGGN